MKEDRRWLWACLILALGLRIVNIDSRGIQYDDAFSILLSRQSLPDILTGTAPDSSAPLYYIMLHFWGFQGAPIWWFRSLSILFSLGIIVITYFLIKNWLDKKTAIVSAFLLAISPLQIYHAQDIRMYAPLVFFQLTYLTAFFSILKRNKYRLGWVILVISGALVLLTHNLGGFFLITANLILIIIKDWRLLYRLIFAQFITIGMVSPWLINLPEQFQNVQKAFWTPRPGIIEVIQVLTQFHASLPLPGIWMPVAVFISLQVFVITLFTILRYPPKNHFLATFLVLTFSTPLILFCLSYIIRPVFLARSFMVCTCFYLGGCAYVIVSKSKQLPSFFVLGGLIFTSAFSLPYQITYVDFPRSPFKEACEYLAQNHKTDEIIIHDNKLSALPCLVYAPNLPQSFIRDLPGTANDTLAQATQETLRLSSYANPGEISNENDYITLIVFEQTLQEARENKQTSLPSIAWLDAHYQRYAHQNFGDLSIYRYRKHS